MAALTTESSLKIESSDSQTIGMTTEMIYPKEGTMKEIGF